MRFTWRSNKLSLGSVLVTLLIGGPFGYFGLTLLNEPPTRIAGLALLGVALLMVGSLVWQAIRMLVLVLSLAIRAWAPDTRSQPENPDRPHSLTTWVDAAVGSAIFIVSALWLAATGRWMFALFFGSMCVPLLAMTGVKAKKREEMGRTHPYRFLLFTVPFALGSLMAATTGEWGGALVIGIFPLLLIILAVSVLAERRLGRRMRASVPVKDEASPSVAAQATETIHAPLPAEGVAPLAAPTHTIKLQSLPPTLPAPPFAVTVFEPERPPQIAETTKAFIEQRQQSIGASALAYRRGASFLWFWLAGLLLLVLLSKGTLQPYSASLFGTFTFLHLLMLFNVSGWFQKTVRMYGWMGLSGVWLASIVFVAFVAVQRFFQVLSPVFSTVSGVSAALSAAQALGLAWAMMTGTTIILLAGLSLFLYRRKMRREISAVARALQTDRPLKLLFLWVFGSDAVMKTLMGNSALWGLLGSMQVLCGRGFMGGLNELVPAFFSKKHDPLVETPEELRVKLASFKYTPHWTGRYYTNSLLCHDRVWEDALHTLLADTAVVLMSLSEFSAQNDGCVYELGQLIDRIPTQRFLLLVDHTTDMEALRAALRQAWDGMAAESPNRGAGGPIQVYPIRWLRVEPIERDSENPPTAQEPAYEERRREGVQIEVEHIVNLLCDGALQATAPSGRSELLAAADLPAARVSP